MQVICDVGLEIFEWRIAEPSSRGVHRVRGGDRCLYRELPNRETIERAHDEAHGSVPNEVLEVDPAVVDAFLGRIKDPPPMDTSAGKAEAISIDPGFRAIMFTDLKDSTLMTTLYGDTKRSYFSGLYRSRPTHNQGLA